MERFAGVSLRLTTLLMLPCVLLFCGTAKAQSAPSLGTVAQKTDLERKRIELEYRKHELAGRTAADQQQIERIRLDMERQKLGLERAKLDTERARMPWMAASTAVPLLGVLLTIVFGVWRFGRQTEVQSRVASEAAKLDFEMKAAEIAFAGRTPQAVLNRGKALRAIFKERLPGGFVDDFDPIQAGGDAEPSEGKYKLLELLVKYPEQKQDILEYWEQLYPGDTGWLQRIAARKTRRRWPPLITRAGYAPTVPMRRSKLRRRG